MLCFDFCYFFGVELFDDIYGMFFFLIIKWLECFLFLKELRMGLLVLGYVVYLLGFCEIGFFL